MASLLKATFHHHHCKNARTSKDWILDEELGLWTTETPLTMCDAYLVQERNEVYAKHTNGCYVCHTHVQGSTSTYTLTSNQTSTPPTTSTFTPIQRVFGKIICTDAITVQDFSAFLTQLNPSIKRLLGNLFTQQVDAQYWITKLNDNEGPVDCDPSLIQSYCAKLTGILVTCYLTHSLSLYCETPATSEVTTHVDNIATVATNNLDEPYTGVAAHTGLDIYILQEIWSLKKSIKLKAEWVE
eukprot:15358846-Ditylum_brightwellii.AAC.1